MPLIIPENLINEESLKKEHIFLMDRNRASSQDIRPIKVAIVNLMPIKETAEIQFLRLLSNQPLQIEIDLIRTESYKPKNSDISRLNKFYKSYDEIKNNKYDAMIVTGAPLEKIKYEEIQYWEELKKIFDFAKENVFSTMFICWAAQAAMHYFYNVESVLHDDKISGIYTYKKKCENILFKGFDDYFNMPQSRYSSVREESLKDIQDIKVLASSDETGVAITTSLDNRFVFSFGHFEYDANTLHEEYIRDINKGINIAPPKNYYYEDKIDESNIICKWRSAGNLFFSNWINYAVYQETPYDIEKISTKKVAKFGGSSLSDSKQFEKVKNIISKDKDRDVIVVSAPGKRNPLDTKITDMLIKLDQDNKEIKELKLIIENLENRLENIGSEKEKNINEIEKRFISISKELENSNEIKEVIINTIKEASSSESTDFILSRGEYLSAKIMADYLNYDFIDAKDLIYFSEKGVDLEKSYENIKRTIKEGQKVVVPGFYGNYNGKVRVFNRGGSDFTGSIIASALDTEVYENWTDVDGVMNADPSKDKNARTIPKLKYSELKKIIENGAQVYQEEAIAPVMEKNITIRILNTNNPDKKGTFIKD